MKKCCFFVSCPSLFCLLLCGCVLVCFFDESYNKVRACVLFVVAYVLKSVCVCVENKKVFCTAEWSTT